MATKFVLIGSGLAGGLLAAYLGRRGYDVDHYERRADPREGNIVGGRSINLALSTRGINALEELGIANELLRHAIPMRGRMIHDKSGVLHFSSYDRDLNKFINSIGRAALNTTVIEAAQRYPSVRVHFNHRCTNVDLESATAKLVPSGVEAAVAAANSDHQIIRARADAVVARRFQNQSNRFARDHSLCTVVLQRQNRTRRRRCPRRRALLWSGHERRIRRLRCARQMSGRIPPGSTARFR